MNQHRYTRSIFTLIIIVLSLYSYSNINNRGEHQIGSEQVSVINDHYSPPTYINDKLILNTIVVYDNQVRTNGMFPHDCDIQGDEIAIVENNTFAIDSLAVFSFAINVLNCDTVIIRNNTIVIDIPQVSPASLTSMIGIKVSNSQSVEIYDNTISTITTVEGAQAAPVRCKNPSNQEDPCNAVGIFVENSQGVNITDNLISDLMAPEYSEAVGIKLVNSNGISIYDNTLDQNGIQIDSDYIGIELIGSSIEVLSNKIRNIKVKNNLIAMKLNSSNNVDITMNRISDLNSTGRGITVLDLVDSSSFNFSSNLIDSIVSSATGFDFTNSKAVYAMSIDDGDDNHIFNNTFSGFESNSNVFGILYNASSSSNITSNRFIKFVGDKVSGLDLQSLSTGSIVIGNNFSDFTGNVLNAIVGRSTNLEIQGNRIMNFDNQIQSVLVDLGNADQSNIDSNLLQNHSSSASLLISSLDRPNIGIRVVDSSNVQIQSNNISSMFSIGAPNIPIYLDNVNDSTVDDNQIQDIFSQVENIGISIKKSTDLGLNNNNLKNIRLIKKILLLYADGEGRATLVRDHLHSLGFQVTSREMAFSTPSLAEILPYDLVFVWSNFAINKPNEIGDILANYTDAGGALILGGFTSFISNAQLKGRIADPDYAVFSNTTIWETKIYNGSSNHEIFNESPNIVTSYGQNVTLVENSTLLASFTDGTPFVGHKGNIININAYPSFGYTGNLPQIWIKSMNWLISKNFNSTTDQTKGIEIIQSDNVFLNHNTVTEVPIWANIDESNSQIVFSGNIIYNTNLYVTSMSLPSDRILDFNHVGEVLNWKAIVNPANQASRYEIFQNNMLKSSGIWESNLNISFPLANLTEGFNIIELHLIQVNGLIITDIVEIFLTETTLPILTDAPEDIRLVEGSTEKFLSWTAIDVNPGTYNILRNNTNIASGNWESGIPIIHTLNTLPIGVFNFSIIIKDNSGNQISHHVLATILTPFEIFFTKTPEDVFYIFNTTNHMLVWQVDSIDNGNYIVERDGTAFLEGDWIPRQDITINIDGLEVGDYVFSILVIDDVGNILTDDVNVQVLPIQETPEDDDEGFDFLTLPGVVNTDLRGPIEENPVGFGIFTALLLTGVLGYYFYWQKRRLSKISTDTAKKATKKAPAKKSVKKSTKKASKKKTT